MVLETNGGGLDLRFFVDRGDDAPPLLLGGEPFDEHVVPVWHG